MSFSQSAKGFCPLSLKTLAVEHQIPSSLITLSADPIQGISVKAAQSVKMFPKMAAPCNKLYDLISNSLYLVARLQRQQFYRVKTMYTNSPMFMFMMMEIVDG